MVRVGISPWVRNNVLFAPRVLRPLLMSVNPALIWVVDNSDIALVRITFVQFLPR